MIAGASATILDHEAEATSEDSGANKTESAWVPEDRGASKAAWRLNAKEKEMSALFKSRYSGLPAEITSDLVQPQPLMVLLLLLLACPY